MSFTSVLLTVVWVWSLVPTAESLSVDEVSRAFKLDSIIVNLLKNYLQQASEEGSSFTENNTQIQYVKRYVDEHQQLLAKFGNPADNSVKTAADGLAALVLTRRLARDWPKLLRINHDKNNTSVSSIWKDVKSRVVEAEQELSLLIEEEDLMMQSTNFAKLITMYKVRPEEATLHHSPGHQSTVSIQIKDAILIGASALGEKMYGTAADLFTLAQQQLNESSTTDASTLTSSMKSVVEKQLKHLVHLAISLHDRRLKTEGFVHQDGMYSRPLAEVSTTEQKQVEKERELDEILDESLRFRENIPTAHHPVKEDWIRFGHICRGHSFMSQAERSQLRCRLDSRGSPYLLLMPALVEEHSLNPKLFTFHRVLTDNQTEHITTISKPFLDQATFFDSKDELSSFKIRSSYTAWLREDTNPVLRNVNKRISALTGLDLDENKFASEPLQVNLYGAGGHYSPHLDSFNLYEKSPNNSSWRDDYFDGDRIATFMFYMNDVEIGGYTAFPRIGVGVRPSRGSAVFWKNLFPDGSEDTRLLHGACPVLKGIKWVSNKWIRHDPQFKRQPCPLTRTNIRNKDSILTK